MLIYTISTPYSLNGNNIGTNIFSDIYSNKTLLAKINDISKIYK